MDFMDKVESFVFGKKYDLKKREIYQVSFSDVAKALNLKGVVKTCEVKDGKLSIELKVTN